MKKEILTLNEFTDVVNKLVKESRNSYYTVDLKVTVYADNDEMAIQQATAYCDMIKQSDDAPCSIQGITQVFGVGDNRKVELF